MKYLAPTPWEVDRQSEGRSWTNSISIKDAEGGEVAILTRGYEGDANGDGCPSWTNASLISAAPEMLRCLETLLPYAEDHQDDGPPGCGWKSSALETVIKESRAAIAKAKGEPDAQT